MLFDQLLLVQFPKFYHMAMLQQIFLIYDVIKVFSLNLNFVKILHNFHHKQFVHDFLSMFVHRNLIFDDLLGIKNKSNFLQSPPYDFDCLNGRVFAPLRKNTTVQTLKITLGKRKHLGGLLVATHQIPTQQ